MASCLQAAGYRVGLYTSPFINRFNERIQINGQQIPDEALVELVEQVKPAADAMEDVPTEFEIITALGMLWFVRLRPDGAEPASSECAAGAADVSEILAAMADAHGLSEREGEVLGLLYRGNTQKKIAERLFLSVSSVQTYAKSLYRKLGVHSRQELIDMVNEAANGNDRAR